MRRDGTERDGTGRNGTERDGTGRNGTERDGTGRNVSTSLADAPWDASEIMRYDLGNIEERE